MKTAENTLWITRGAFIAALFSAITPFVFSTCSDKDMTIRELNSTVKAISIPNTIKTELQNDTIKAVIVDDRKSKTAQ